MRGVLLGVIFLFLSCSARAEDLATVRKTIEASMLVTGNILVGPQGRVEQFAIDRPEKIERGVLNLVKANIDQWVFEPQSQDGAPVAVRNKMSVLVIGSKLENGDFAFRLGGVSFLPFEKALGTRISSDLMPFPRYPTNAARAGATATVYLAVKVGTDGKVHDVVAEQTNLRYVAAESVMQQLRKSFEDTSIAAARKWKFKPPVIGEDADEPYWTVRVPCDYLLGAAKPRYGKWEAYVPGPRHPIPWKGLRDMPGFSPDTMVADGNVYQAGEGLRLLTPLQGG